jgi:hypothetical protein
MVVCHSIKTEEPGTQDVEAGTIAITPVDVVVEQVPIAPAQTMLTTTTMPT